MADDMVADEVVPHFQNDIGSAQINISVKKFMCCGASQPYDHPHVFLDMGSEVEIICPYCSTLFKYSDKLQAGMSDPENCFFDKSAA